MRALSFSTLALNASARSASRRRRRREARSAAGDPRRAPASGTRVGAREAAREDEILQRLGVQRPDVRDVADVAVEERDPARRVQRLEDHAAAGAELVEGELEELQQVSGLQVLDHLRGEDAAERCVGERREVADGVGFGDVEAARAAELGHLVIQIDAARADAGAGEQLEKLAAPAADVEHVGGAGEERQVAFEPRPDRVARAAELILEPDVLVAVEGPKQRPVVDTLNLLNPC